MWLGIEIGIGVYCALVGGLFAFQRRLMYFPAKLTAPPSAFGLNGVEDVFVETSARQGTSARVSNWVTPARDDHSPCSTSSKLWAAIDPDRVAGDPAGVVGGEEGDHAADVIRLGEALQGLHAEREIPARLRLREVSHVGLHHAWGDGVDANAARAK